MEFILEIDKAKTIFRQTYLSDGKRKENDAEHSWHTAIMAFTLAEYFDPDVDVLKVGHHGSSTSSSDAYA